MLCKPIFVRYYLITVLWHATLIIYTYVIFWTPAINWIRFDISIKSTASNHETQFIFIKILLKHIKDVYSRTIFEETINRIGINGTKSYLLCKVYAKMKHTVHPLLCFTVISYWSILPIYLRVTSLALEKSYDCPSASDPTLKRMAKWFTWID